MNATSPDSRFPPEGGPLDPDGYRRLIAAEPGTARVDVRGEEAFAAGHVAGSGHLPAAELAARRTELPPRERPLIVLAGSPEAAREAAGTLGALGYGRVAWLAAPLDALGPEAAARGAPARLWQPAPFLARIVERLPRGRAADLAAGSGRDAAFLALHGFDVEAWDEAPEALATAAALARRSGVRIETRVANLESRGFTLPESRYALVTCFRFLHRPLFPVMARALAPGGHLVYETYRVGQERFGRPRRARFLLLPGELGGAFRALGLEVLLEEEPDPPGGPVTSRVWARRPA